MDSSYGKIPGQLRVYPHWVCGRADKSPVNPRSGGNALANVPDTWGTFAEALAYLETHKDNGIKTIGFEMGGKGPFTGIDMDYCRNPETEEIEPWAMEIITALDSYTEVSPSGTGIRVFTNGGDDFSQLNRKKGGLGASAKGVIEIANSGKYFSTTGNHLEGTPDWITHNPSGLLKVCNQYFQKKAQEEKKPTEEETPEQEKDKTPFEDEALLKKMFSSSNGQKARKLFDGDYSGYPSQSEADLALCSLLAFWTRKNAEQMDRLFRQSQLYRKKWDEKHFADGSTYGAETIRKAIETTSETYEDKKSQSKTQPNPGTKLIFPDIMRGFAGRFAKTYSEITEAPEVFYYFAALVCLGSYLSGRINLNTLLNVQPRLYVVFLGPSGRGRKSTPITISTEFFQGVFEDFALLHHANSGEGLGVYLGKNRNTLLCYDEFLGFVSKAIQKGNTLLGTVSTLFEKNAYQTATKTKQLIIPDAHLSMLGACTTDTWERCWEADFTAIGLNNRLFLVPGAQDSLISIPPKVDEYLWKSLRDELRDVVSHALKVKEYSLTPAAFALYDKWYKEGLDHRSVHAVRLDQYALRFMLLFAANEQKNEIDNDIVKAAIALAEWEHKVRQQFDPIDVDNEAAKVEARILRALISGPKNKRELQQKTAASRSGKWLWGHGLENLLRDGDICYDKKQYALVKE